ncbi:group II intron reverse transcriptase/maturase, partial [Vibrio anguillarum]|nr:group II intron reverse transcriptase/maturase [Vibrio anguillarum]
MKLSESNRGHYLSYLRISSTDSNKLKPHRVNLCPIGYRCALCCLINLSLMEESKVHTSMQIDVSAS